jgi:hypothetical protein
LLTTAYAEAHRGNVEALDEPTIRSDFRQAVAPQIAQLREVYGNGERLDQIVTEAEDFLVANRRRYAWKERPQATNQVNI